MIITQDMLGFSTKAPLRMDEAENRIYCFVYIKKKKKKKKAQQGLGNQMISWELCIPPSLDSAFFPPAAAGSCSNYLITLSLSKSASLSISGPARVTSPSHCQFCFS